MDICEIGREAHKINGDNGWDVLSPRDWPANGDLEKSRFICTHMALVHTEVSEATEAVRERDLANFREELADVIIRVTSIAFGLGIDIDAEIQAKLAKNKTRGYRHGGKAI